MNIGRYSAYWPVIIKRAEGSFRKFFKSLNISIFLQFPFGFGVLVASFLSKK